VLDGDGSSLTLGPLRKLVAIRNMESVEERAVVQRDYALVIATRDG